MPEIYLKNRLSLLGDLWVEGKLGTLVKGNGHWWKDYCLMWEHCMPEMGTEITL